MAWRANAAAAGAARRKARGDHAGKSNARERSANNGAERKRSFETKLGRGENSALRAVLPPRPMRARVSGCALCRRCGFTGKGSAARSPESKTFDAFLFFWPRRVRG
jgi:hypothetical protein